MSVPPLVQHAGGAVSLAIARRMGLYDSATGQKHLHYCWRCPEFEARERDPLTGEEIAPPEPARDAPGQRLLFDETEEKTDA